eukprot:snap_masked-scaffold_24-processed-gene-4.31-mRNA-1 protein AED:1.00 eAED:1.00 QI:0/-1/0/0/-1/1/1/0/420
MQTPQRKIGLRTQRARQKSPKIYGYEKIPHLLEAATCLKLDELNKCPTDAKEKDALKTHMIRHFTCLNLRIREEFYLARRIRDIFLEFFDYPLNLVATPRNLKKDSKCRKPTKEEILKLRPMVKKMMETSQKEKKEQEQRCQVRVHSPNGNQRRYRYFDKKTGNRLHAKEYGFRLMLSQSGFTYQEYLDGKEGSILKAKEICQKLGLRMKMKKNENEKLEKKKEVKIEEKENELFTEVFREFEVIEKEIEEKIQDMEICFKREAEKLHLKGKMEKEKILKKYCLKVMEKKKESFVEKKEIQIIKKEQKKVESKLPDLTMKTQNVMIEKSQFETMKEQIKREEEEDMNQTFRDLSGEIYENSDVESEIQSINSDSDSFDLFTDSEAEKENTSNNITRKKKKELLKRRLSYDTNAGMYDTLN